MRDNCKGLYLEPGMFEGNIRKASQLVSHVMLASHSGAVEETISSLPGVEKEESRGCSTSIPEKGTDKGQQRHEHMSGVGNQSIPF